MNSDNTVQKWNVWYSSLIWNNSWLIDNNEENIYLMKLNSNFQIIIYSTVDGSRVASYLNSNNIWNSGYWTLMGFYQNI